MAIFAARSAFPSRASRRWRKVYGNLPPSEARELKPLRDEYKKLKRLVADLSLDKGMLQDVLSKKVLKPVRQREVVRYLLGRDMSSKSE